VATINPLRYFGCVDEVKKQIDLGIRLFRFFPEYQEWTPDDPCFRRLLDRALGRTGVALMISAEAGINCLERLAARIDSPVIMEGPSGVQNGNLMVVMQEHPNFLVESHRMTSVDWVEVLTREVGSDQILYGSYAPLKYMQAAMDQVTNAFVADETKQKILSGNIQRALGVDL
jgi:predicted TIM-barrel fold metal-dependent hydrolase